MRSAAIILVVIVCSSLANAAVKIKKSWNGGFSATTCIDVYKNLKGGWTVHFSFSKDIKSMQVWTGRASKVSPRHFTVAGTNHLQPGSKHCFDMVVKCKCRRAPRVSAYLEGNRSSKNYAHALELSLLFYSAQRSGRLPSNNPISWRGDSALGDCVTGGWYDAGDHVKFGLPMAASTTILTWSLIRYKDGYQRAGQLNQMYDSIKWPLDYFLKAWDSGAQSLVVQVGDGKLDHDAGWIRAEEMHMERPCLRVDRNTQGSDIAAETAAAMAAGSIAFKEKGDYGYARRLQNAATSLYDFAKNHKGVFKGAEPYYKSTGYKDEMCLGAMFLYKATKDRKYLEDAKSFVTKNAPWSLSWDSKDLACQILLFEETGQYKASVQNFFNSWSEDNGMTYTPCGLAWRSKWGTNRYAANAAFAALVAADLGIDTYENRKWAVEQINYLLGDNKVNGMCLSFLVGFGKDFPQQPHHRGASCPDFPARCDEKNQHANSPNPHVLYGALIGGPGPNDNYKDERSNYEANEVTTDYNAGFQGALAAIIQLEGSANFPWAHNKCPCY